MQDVQYSTINKQSRRIDMRVFNFQASPQKGFIESAIIIMQNLKVF